MQRTNSFIKKKNNNKKTKILYHVYKTIHVHVLKCLKDQGILLLKVILICTGSRGLIHGVTAREIQKTNMYALTMLHCGYFQYRVTHHQD